MKNIASQCPAVSFGTTMHRMPALFAMAVCALVLPDSAVASVFNVSTAADFQPALDAAQPGDTILLAAGATFIGSFSLPAKSGTDFITITTSDPTSLPPAGVRITPATAVRLPKILTWGGLPAIDSQPGAHHYRLLGLELGTAPGIYTYDVLRFNAPDTDPTQYPHDIVVDQLYIHGDPVVGSKRGIALNGAGITIRNCYLSDFKSSFQEAQAIAGWNGPGPYVIANNYIEGATENILFGGALPTLVHNVPSNITIDGNYISKPLAWKNVWGEKNLLELKNARHVTITRNTFENSWCCWQRGQALVFTVRTGGDPAAVVEDVSVDYNLFKGVDGLVRFGGWDDAEPPATQGSSTSIQIRNNLALINPEPDPANPYVWVLGFGGLTNQVTIDHNTIIDPQSEAFVFLFNNKPNYGLVFTNNIASLGWGGIIADLGGPTGAAAIASYFPGGEFFANVLWIENTYVATDVAGNFYPKGIGSVGFADPANGNYALSSTSPYRGAGTDGADLGADLTMLASSLQGVISGDSRLYSDVTPPLIVPDAGGTYGMGGWFVSNVGINWNVSDPESGIASSVGCGPSSLTSETAGLTVTCMAVNGAGLKSSGSVGIKIDKTGPVISGMPAQGCNLRPANGKLVSVADVTARDAFSGLDPSSFRVAGTSNQPATDSNDIIIGADGTGGYSVQLRATRTSTPRIYTLTATARDLAGNTTNVMAQCTVGK